MFQCKAIDIFLTVSLSHHDLLYTPLGEVSARYIQISTVIRHRNPGYPPMASSNKVCGLPTCGQSASSAFNPQSLPKGTTYGGLGSSLSSDGYCGEAHLRQHAGHLQRVYRSVARSGMLLGKIFLKQREAFLHSGSTLTSLETTDVGELGWSGFGQGLASQYADTMFLKRVELVRFLPTAAWISSLR
jgi:hypothetical protein